MNKTRVKNMSLIALGSAVLAVCAWLTVPFAVPFTMQTFGIFLILLLLGGKRGFVSILLYIVLGIIGIPVFSGFNAGLSVLLGPSGGFIWGFAVLGCIYLALESITLKRRSARLVTLLLGLFFCYLLGTLFYINWCALENNFISFGSAFSVCVLPYILPDVIKLILAYIISNRISRVISI